MHQAVVVDPERLDPPPGLLVRLRQLIGYTWDDSIQPFHSSYDIWHIFGAKQIVGGSSPLLPTSTRPGNAPTWYDVTIPKKTGQDGGDRSSEFENVGETAIKVVARISVHALREERAYHMVKTLTSTADSHGYYTARPLDMLRLKSQHGDDGPIAVCIFEYAGPNHLPKVVDFGPAWYNLHLRGDTLHGFRSSNFVSEPMSLQTFLDFAIGAAECIEVLHGQQIVHGELRGDAFHMNIETGRVKLIHIGGGLRAFEHGLTSTGWATLSNELGVKTKLSYMSPEQTGRMPVKPDSRTDIFSLGIILWTILMGKPAFEGETPMDILQAVLGQRLPLVSNVRLDIPDVIGRIIQKATVKSVSERYRSISGLRYDLVEVRKLLGTGDSAQLLNWKIGTKDVSPSFSLAEIMVGRTTEHDTIVKVIDHAFKLRQNGQRHDKHGIKHLSSLPEGQFAGFESVFIAEDTFLEEDNRSSTDETTNSLFLSDASPEGPKPSLLATGKFPLGIDLRHDSIEDASDPRLSDLQSSGGRLSAALESTSVTDSINGDSGAPRSNSGSAESVAVNRNKTLSRTTGRCEVITVEGAPGLGKTRLIQSVQVEARQRGYFASSKFDQAEKTPFGPVVKLLSSLFQQAFSESHMDPGFYQLLQQHAAPVWPTLHKVLSLPEFLLGPRIASRTASQSRKPSKTFDRSRSVEVERRDPSPTSSRSSIFNKTLGAQSSQDFLRAGSSTKSLPLMNIFLEILRIFSRYKFVCLCLDDLQSADEESMELIQKIIYSRLRMVIILAYSPENISPDTIRGILNPSSNEEHGKTGDIGIRHVVLKPLSETDVMEYVAATLCQPRSAIFGLGAVIQSKTAGNPFYIREMLDACHRKKCVWYDYRENGWVFDLDHVFRQFKMEDHNDILGDDIVVNRLNELPVASRSILSWAALLGPSFSFHLIQRLLNGDFVSNRKDRKPDAKTAYLLFQSEQDSIKGLQAAIQAYIIIPTEDDDVFHFAHDRYMVAAVSLWDGNEKLMHFIMAQTLLKYYSLGDKYYDVTATSVYKSVDVIKSSVVHRQSFRKLLFDYAYTACERGVRSTAVKFYASCIALLQDDMWNDEAEDVYYEETLHLFTAAAECYLYRGQYQEAMDLLQSVSSNAKTAVDKAPSWILQSRVFAQVGDSSSAFQALKQCLVTLDVEVDNDPTFPKCDIEFKRLCLEIQSIGTDILVKKPMGEDSKLTAVGAVLVEATSAAFWSDTLTFYQMTLIMVNKYLSSGSFPQAGMGFLHLALIAITRHNMIHFASNCGEITIALVDRWKDPYTIGRAGTIYSTFLGHIQHPLQRSIAQLEGALEYAIQAGDRISTILNFGLVGNLKFFVSENLAELEVFCKYGCQDIPNWHLDTPGGTMIITIRQVCRALQGKTYIGNPLQVMSDEQHDSPKYKAWLTATVKNSDRPLMLYESMEIAPLFLYGHYSSAIAVGNSCLKKINAIWSARNTRFLMFFHSLSLAGPIWTRVHEQLDPIYRKESPQLSSDISGRSFEAGLQEEMEGLATMMKYFKRRIEQWQVITDVNYLAWSKILGAQIAEIENDHTGALRLYEEALDHASAHNFVFEEALANQLLGGHLLRIGSRRLAKSALREATSLYRQIGATGVACHVEDEHHEILQEVKYSHSTANIGVQTDADETLSLLQPHIAGFEQSDSQIPEPLTEHGRDNIEMWQDGYTPVNDSSSLALHMLDWTSILESSQVISSVLQVDQLLKTMCEIILQNCKGVATLVAIIVEEDQPVGWAIAASGDPEEGAKAHKPSIPLRESALIAESVVNYCTRFQATVFLSDLMQDLRFSNVNEAWVTRNPGGKSVMACPICHGDKGKQLLGVLYLEGRPNAFTNRNLEVLQLLVNQIGISYSNALTLEEVKRVSAINKSMVDVQKKALSEAVAAENKANVAKAEALSNARLAQEAAKAKTTFLANISHELRTPLNGVIGNSELLLDSQLPRQQAEMVDSIRVSADLLLSLINDILDLSKMEANKMQLHLTPFNINEMIQELVRSIPIDIKNKKISVLILQDIRLPQSLVYGDPVRLRQILGNLLSNSLKFTKKGSITIGAKIDWETDVAVQLTFWSKDTGIGIAPQQLHKLFQPFSQADASTARKYGGSGLGLSICKSLVESMGGTIKLESEEAVGTTVSFSLTLPKPDPGAKVERIQKKSSHDGTSDTDDHPRATSGYTSLKDVPHDRLRICIAEDNLINQKIALRFLENLNFKEVDTFVNGSAAVEGIRKKAMEGRPYHIILMDVQMPVMDGYEATKLLRQDEMDAVQGILIIALTASAVQGDREKCIASGMNDYLAKPVRLAILKKKLSQYIQVE